MTTLKRVRPDLDFLGNLRYVKKLVALLPETWNEAYRVSVSRTTLEFAGLPDAFDGVTFVFLSDLHCHKDTPAFFQQHILGTIQHLHPDFILLGGDYVTKAPGEIALARWFLQQLRAPLGVYGVFGNHDYWVDLRALRQSFKENNIVDLTNEGAWLIRHGKTIRLAGVGDLWEDRQDLERALHGTRHDDFTLLLSHNPDFAPQVNDARVKLILSGHTHGGQVRLPGVGALFTNTKHFHNTSSGLISRRSFQLYISRGLGTVVLPLRYQCPPEVAFFTLRTPQK